MNERGKSDPLAHLLGEDDEMPPVHGGDPAAAERIFPDGPRPWIDLSTGVSPFAYPLPDIRDEAWRRLPHPEARERLLIAAAVAYGAEVVAGSGTHGLMNEIVRLLPPTEAAIVSPTYAEHARSCKLAGHRVREVADPASVPESARLVIVVNPNNPTGQIFGRSGMLELAERVSAAKGLLIVDEAFMDSIEPDQSLCGLVAERPLVVLRSFGKFYGLPGLRLGFAVADRSIASRLASAMGPWPVSGAAIEIGAAALGDRRWQDSQRKRLASAASRLDGLLRDAGFAAEGASPLFRIVASEKSTALFNRLGGAGIWTRRFSNDPNLLRLGLPGSDHEWSRVQAALEAKSVPS